MKRRRAPRTVGELACPRCNQEFRSEANREYHIQYLCGQRSYQCPACPRMTSRRDNFRTHVKRMHPEIPLDQILL